MIGANHTLFAYPYGILCIFSEEVKNQSNSGRTGLIYSTISILFANKNFSSFQQIQLDNNTFNQISFFSQIEILTSMVYSGVTS